MAESTGTMRAQIEARWAAVIRISETLGGGNKALIRALDIFAGCRDVFEAASTEDGIRSPAEFSSGRKSSHHEGHELGTVVPFPAGNAIEGADSVREAYFRAEESLRIVREQIQANDANIRLMADEVEGARRHIGARYATGTTQSRTGRGDTRAAASAQALDRGEVGCLTPPIEVVRAMTGLLRMHQSELEMQETIVDDIGYEVDEGILMAYREALKLRPFIDDRFMCQMREMRELSNEIETKSTEMDDAVEKP